MNKNTEFQKFDATTRKLIQVPHDKLKAALDPEKVGKQKSENLRLPLLAALQVRARTELVLRQPCQLARHRSDAFRLLGTLQCRISQHR